MQKIIKKIKAEFGDPKDLHVIRHFSALVFISDGKVIKVTEPSIKHCPLAQRLYPGLKTAFNNDNVKVVIANNIEEKIDKFGFFTKDRILKNKKKAIPYGASEMLMMALKKNVIDCAVTVCDGAGTVCSSDPQVVQGIGGRMNAILYTSPIKEIMQRLEALNSYYVSDNAKIDQAKGVRIAAEKGAKDIAVTVNAFSEEDYRSIRLVEKETGLSVTVLTVCTTGISKERMDDVVKYSDMIWGCANSVIEKRMSKTMLKKIPKDIPVYIMTEKGVKIEKAYGN